MASLPYVTAPGNIDRALVGIKSAAVPSKVSQDFVKTILKIPGGSGTQITSLLRKLGFVQPDGSPSEIYKRFRNPTSSGAAIYEAMKLAYAPLYVRNEFMHELSEADLTGLVVEETGEAHDASSVRLTVNCIKHLKKFAAFTAKEVQSGLPAVSVADGSGNANGSSQGAARSTNGIGLNLGYTINLNLPPTSDPAVFDAIFKSLKTHLLTDEDA